MKAEILSPCQTQAVSQSHNEPTESNPSLHILFSQRATHTHHTIPFNSNKKLGILPTQYIYEFLVHRNKRRLFSGTPFNDSTSQCRFKGSCEQGLLLELVDVHHSG